MEMTTIIIIVHSDYSYYYSCYIYLGIVLRMTIKFISIKRKEKRNTFWFKITSKPEEEKNWHTLSVVKVM